MLTIPNLAHFASRVTFALAGKLLRTSTIDRHKGDRPIGEYIKLCRNHGLKLVNRRGLFPTFPLISALTMLAPSRVVGLHKVYNTLLAPPGYCFLNILELRHAEPQASGEQPNLVSIDKQHAVGPSVGKQQQVA